MEVTMEENQYFEDYLKASGWGLYNKFIVVLSCACNFVQAATFVTVPLAVALSTCSTNFIPEHVTLRTFTSFYMGSCFGGLVANFLSDRYGRKRYLSYSLMFIFLSTFTAAFAHNAYVIIGASLFLGVGLETNIVAVKLLMVEILPKEIRGAYMIFCNIFWALGYVLTTALVIYLETPALSETPRTPETNLTTWRLMFAFCGGANLLLACVCALIEESPRYFLQMGRSYLSYLVLKQLFAINNSSFAENFKVQEEEIKNLIPQHGLFYLEPESYWDIFLKLSWRFYNTLKLMFSYRFCRTTCVLVFLKIPVLVVGILQLDISLAKKLIFNWSPNMSDYKYRGLDFIYPIYEPLTYISSEERSNSTTICGLNGNNSIFYRHFLILGSAVVPGLIISAVIVDRLGRKFLLFAGLFLTGCSFLILTFIKGYIVQLVASCIILTSVGSIISLLSLINLEAYPTAIRGTSCGVTNFFGLFLTVIFINFIAIETNLFTFTMGALYLCISTSTFFLPELKEKSLTE